MLGRDLGADRVLAGVAVLQKEIAAGDLDVADEPRRGVDAALFAHEGDGAVAIDRDALGDADAGTQRIFHKSLLLAASAAAATQNPSPAAKAQERIAHLTQHFDEMETGLLVARPEAAAVKARDVADGGLALQRGELGRGFDVPEAQRPVRWRPKPVVEAPDLVGIDRREQHKPAVNERERACLAAAVGEAPELVTGLDVPKPEHLILVG